VSSGRLSTLSLQVAVPVSIMSTVRVSMIVNIESAFLSGTVQTVNESRGLQFEWISPKSLSGFYSTNIHRKDKMRVRFESRNVLQRTITTSFLLYHPQHQFLNRRALAHHVVFVVGRALHEGGQSCGRMDGAAGVSDHMVVAEVVDAVAHVLLEDGRTPVVALLDKEHALSVCKSGSVRFLDLDQVQPQPQPVGTAPSLPMNGTEP
jgi:hypothetical protein